MFCLDNLAEYTDGIIFETFTDLEDFFSKPRPEFRCICRFTGEDFDDHDRLFDFVWEVGHCTLIAEEVDWYTNDKKFLRLVRYGRHHAIDIIAVTRTPPEASTMLRSQADETISFRQTEPAHLEWTKKKGFDVEQIQRLANYEYLTITY